MKLEMIEAVIRSVFVSKTKKSGRTSGTSVADSNAFGPSEGADCSVPYGGTYAVGSLDYGVTFCNALISVLKSNNTLSQRDISSIPMSAEGSVWDSRTGRGLRSMLTRACTYVCRLEGRQAPVADAHGRTCSRRSVSVLTQAAFS